ncbi:MAG TPA: biotin-dependent carboxyltransferase family protein [Gemmatimonadaceae bacterium]|nr:biotin-dependent carboxyltransferase family protein [Gemmatimonadaceae bacterium]
MITVAKAPPYLAVQDAGRTGFRAAGVPRGGAMDLFALRAGNLMVGNQPDSAALEWALGGGTLTFSSAVCFALVGATVRATIGGRSIPPCTTTAAAAGEELIVEQFLTGRFLYVAISGGIEVPDLLGSRSTYLPGHFGGFGGRLIRTGDSLPFGTTPSSPPVGFHCAAELMPRYDTDTVHMTRGPQAELFTDEAFRILSEEPHRVSSASDRTGYKIDGPSIGSSPGSLPSEAACPGAIQVPGDGHPIILMADAPTVGGYPKIGVVSETDLPIIAQRRPGETVRFEVITVEQSQRAMRRRAADLNTIAQLATRVSSARLLHM